MLASEGGKIGDFFLVVTTNDDRVDLDRIKVDRSREPRAGADDAPRDVGGDAFGLARAEQLFGGPVRERLDHAEL